jgi:hypothetical protein
MWPHITFAEPPICIKASKYAGARHADGTEGFKLEIANRWDEAETNFLA